MGNSNRLPLVSVIVPTYKRESFFLKRALDSLLNQTYPNIEIIVINDCVEDKKIENELGKYLEINKIVYVHNEKNLGGALSRNVGIFLSKGQYVTFLDDDDEYLPNKIEHQVAHMDKNGLDLSLTPLKLYNEKNKLIDYRSFEKFNGSSKEYLLKYHLTNHLTGTPTFMFKTEMLKKIGGFDDKKVGQEFYLMLKSIENDLKIGYIPHCFVKAYRHSHGGISYGPNKLKGEKELLKFKKKYFHRLSEGEKNYILFRHYAVLTVVHIRNKNYFQALLSLFATIFTSPKNTIKEIHKVVTRKKMIVRMENNE